MVGGLACAGFLFFFFGTVVFTGWGLFPLLSYFYGLTYYCLVVFVGESSVRPDGMCWGKSTTLFAFSVLVFFVNRGVVTFAISLFEINVVGLFSFVSVLFACAS